MRAGVAVAQQANGVKIRQDQLAQVQHHHGTGWFCVNQLAQVAYLLRVEAAADRKRDRPVRRTLNLQQRHNRAERNCRSSHSE